MSNIPQHSIKPGTRRPVHERHDLIPCIGLHLVAKIMAIGEAQGKGQEWRKYPRFGEDSCLNHALRHLNDTKRHTDRETQVYLVAKAAANLLMHCDILMDHMVHSHDYEKVLSNIDEKIKHATKEHEKAKAQSNKSNN